MIITPVPPSLLFARRLARWAGVALRVGLVLAVLRWLAPAPVYVVLGTPHTVHTEHPVVCTHTRLTDEVEEWKIQRTLALVREMGAPTIVEFFPWPYVESTRGEYDWAHPDRIIEHAEHQGLTVIARLGLVPSWARPPVDEKVTTLTYLPYDEFEAFARFVGAFAARYAGRVEAVIIWNEPNLSREWGNRPVDPDGYTELLRLSYAAAHHANPDIVVMGGALAPTTAASDAALNDIRYLEQMYEAGAGAYFDVLAAHTYGFTHPPEADPAPDVINFRRVELLRAVMVHYGDGDKPVVITESGWNDDPRWSNAVRPGQRSVYTLAAFEMVAGWPWAEELCIWNFRQPLDRRNRRDTYYALVSSEFYTKPVYEAIQAYARGWENPYQLWE
jgi:polysaccharide biosynthesis protein PslG